MDVRRMARIRLGTALDLAASAKAQTSTSSEWAKGFNEGLTMGYEAAANWLSEILCEMNSQALIAELEELEKKEDLCQEFDS